MDGRAFAYSTIWQRMNAVLVILPDFETDESSRSYAARLMDLTPDWKAANTECIITRETVAGVSAAAVAVADRWGEIVYLADASGPARLPDPEDLLDWIRYLENRCPECEGEAK